MLLVADDLTLLVVEARTGNPDAWDRLFRRYQLPLYVYVFELVRNEQESLDIVQETFIKAVRHLGKLREDAKFGSWLFSIAHRGCVLAWRKRARRGDVFDLESLDEGVEVEEREIDPSEVLIRKEQGQEFLALLEQLSPPHRSVLLLHFVEEFSLEQIAEITGAQLGTVKSRMHYAKRALKTLLEEKMK